MAYGDCSELRGNIGACIVIVCFIALFFIIIEFPLSHYNTNCFIAEVEALQKTMDNARVNGTDFENATILKDVMLVNRTLARKKYANTTVYGIWIPDAIMEVEPVK